MVRGVNQERWCVGGLQVNREVRLESGLSEGGRNECGGGGGGGGGGDEEEEEKDG